MQSLAAISVVSFCAVLWIALALARRIQREQLGRRELAAPSHGRAPSFEFFEGGDFRTPRQLRLTQNVAQRVPQPEQHRTGTPFATLGLSTFTPSPVAHDPLSESLLIGPSLDIANQRKAPQSTRSDAFRRVDLSLYNKNSGDLTDPNPARLSGTYVRAKVS